MDTLDQIFSKHSNRNIIMKWTDKDFDSLMNDLFEYFQNEDDVAEFMSSGEVDSYLNKYNIELFDYLRIKLYFIFCLIKKFINKIFGQISKPSIYVNY